MLLVIVHVCWNVVIVREAVEEKLMVPNKDWESQATLGGIKMGGTATLVIFVIMLTIKEIAQLGHSFKAVI